jgi:hypothetical protein
MNFVSLSFRNFGVFLGGGGRNPISLILVEVLKSGVRGEARRQTLFFIGKPHSLMTDIYLLIVFRHSGFRNIDITCLGYLGSPSKCSAQGVFFSLSLSWYELRKGNQTPVSQGR